MGHTNAANADRYRDAYYDPHANGNSGTDKHIFTDADGYRRPYPDGYYHTLPHGKSDINVNADGNRHIHSNSESDTDANGDQHTDAHLRRSSHCHLPGQRFVG